MPPPVKSGVLYFRWPPPNTMRRSGRWSFHLHSGATAKSFARELNCPPRILVRCYADTPSTFPLCPLIVFFFCSSSFAGDFLLFLFLLYLATQSCTPSASAVAVLLTALHPMPTSSRSRHCCRVSSATSRCHCDGHSMGLFHWTLRDYSGRLPLVGHYGIMWCVCSEALTRSLLVMWCLCSELGECWRQRVAAIA